MNYQIEHQGNVIAYNSSMAEAVLSINGNVVAKESKKYEKGKANQDLVLTATTENGDTVEVKVKRRFVFEVSVTVFFNGEEIGKRDVNDRVERPQAKTMPNPEAQEALRKFRERIAQARKENEEK